MTRVRTKRSGVQHARPIRNVVLGIFEAMFFCVVFPFTILQDICRDIHQPMRRTGPRIERDAVPLFVPASGGYHRTQREEVSTRQ